MAFPNYKTYEGERGDATQWAEKARKLLSQVSPDARQQHLAALGLALTPGSLTELRRAYKRAMFEAHPDRGGSEEKIIEITAAYNALLKLL